MGFFDDVSDAVDKAVDTAEDVASDVGDAIGEAAGDVASGAGDVASEVSEGDVGGAVDEAQDTVEDVASGSKDTGSNDSSDDNFTSPDNDSGEGSSASVGDSDTGGGSSGGSSGGGSSFDDDDDDGGGGGSSNNVTEKTRTVGAAAAEGAEKAKNTARKGRDVAGKARDEVSKASEGVNIKQEKKKAKKALTNAQKASRKLDKSQQKIQNDRARKYLINASQLSRKEKRQIGVSTDASGRVEITDQQYNRLLEKRERDAEEQAERFQNFLAEAEKNQEIRDLQAIVNNPDASPEKRAQAAEELADRLGGQQSRRLDQFAEQLKNAPPPKVRKERELRKLVRENPDLLAYGGNFNEANDKPVKSLKSGNLGEFTEDITTGNAAPEGVRKRFKELKNDLNLTKGEIDTIAGEEASQKTTKNLEKPFGSDNPVVQFGAKGVAGLASLAKEAPEALPKFDSKRSFDSKTQQQLFDTRTGRSKTTAEALAQNPQKIELANGETIEVGGGQAESNTPEINVDISEGEKFQLQEARSVSAQRRDELADALGRGVGGLASIPSQVQRRGGQAQQLASGEMTTEEAAKGTAQAIGGAASAIQEDPLKAGVTSVPGLVTGTAVSRATNLGKLRANVIRGARTKLPNRVPGSIDASSGSNTIVLGKSSNSGNQGSSSIDNFPSSEDLPYNIRNAPDPDSQNIENVAPSRQDLLDADADTLSKTRNELTEVPQDILRGGRRSRTDTRSPGNELPESQRNQRLRDIAESRDSSGNELMSLNEEARRKTDLDTANDLGTDRSSVDAESDRASSVKRLDQEEGFRPEAREVLSRRRPGRGVSVEDITETGGLALKVIDESDVGRPTVNLGDAAEAFVDSNRISFAGTGGLIDVIEEQKKVESDFSDAVSGTSGLAGSGDTIDDLALRAGDTGQRDPAIYRNSPARPRVGNDAPAETSGQVISLTGVGTGAVVGAGSRVEDEVVSFDEGRERAAPGEFRSQVIGLEVTEGQLPELAQGRGRGVAAIGGQPIVQPPETQQKERGRGTTGRDVSARDPVEPEVPDIGNPVFDNIGTPANRQGEVVDQRPGQDRRSDTTVFPQSIAASITGVGQDQGTVQRQDQIPVNAQDQDFRVETTQIPETEFGYPPVSGAPGRGDRPGEGDREGFGFFPPNAPETEIFRRRNVPEPDRGNEEEENRRTEPREERFFRGERIWPFETGTDILFGDLGGRDR